MPYRTLEERRAYTREYEKRRPPRREYVRQLQMRPDVRARRIERSRRSYYKKYGITREQFEERKIAQKNLCALCGEPFAKGHKRPVLDHNHKTGQLRGIIHAVCNSGIGFFRDDPILLEKAAAYLRASAIFPELP